MSTRAAVIWPLQVDVFIAVGELALFVALADAWAGRSRAGALAGRATAAVPPLAAALAVGLGVLKRVVEHHHHSARAGQVPPACPPWPRSPMMPKPRHGRH